MHSQGKAYIALIFICIVWGTTYLAIRVGVMQYPPFLFAGIRQFIAGIILGIAALSINKNKDLSRSNILRQMLVGFLMLSIGNGFVTYGEKYVSSGLAALICGMMPLFSVIINLVSSKKEHLNAAIVAGLLLGFCGVGLIFKNNIADLANKAYLGGICCVFRGKFFHGLLAVPLIRNIKAPLTPYLIPHCNCFFGGLFMLIASPVLDGAYTFPLWQPQALMALLYLITFGSVLAYAAYMYVFSALPVGIATIYAYINPLVAVILGYLILKEPLTIYTAFSFIAIFAGVYLVNRGYKKQYLDKAKKFLKIMRL